jgi:hypothetical protein
MKAGYKTTEFWLAATVVMFGSLSSSGLLAENSVEAKIVAGIVAGLTAAGYSLSRGIAKMRNGT